MDASTAIAIRTIDIQDLNDVARVHVAAFARSVLSRTGLETVRRYYAWHLTNSLDPILLGAYDGDDLVGFILAGPSFAPIDRFVAKEFVHLASRVVRRPWAFIDRTAAARASTGTRLVARRVWSALHPRSRASRPAPSSMFTVLAIGVLPETEGRGVARLLMGHAEDVALRRGFHTMTLSVHGDNLRAIRFYRDLGYQEQPTDAGPNALVMRRTLAPSTKSDA